MGILSSVNKFISGNKVLSNLVTPIPNMVSQLTGGKGVVGKAATAISKNPVTTALALAGGAALTTAKGAAAAVSVGKSLIPTSTPGKVAAVIAAPVAAGAVIKQPAAIASAIAKTPSGLVNVGGNLADLSVNPSAENLSNLVKENPVIVGTAVAGATALGASKLLPALATYKQTEAINKQTEAIKGVGTDVPITSANPMTSTANVKPQTAETQIISTTKAKRKSSKRKKLVANPSINIKIDNRDTIGKIYKGGVRV